MNVYECRRWFDDGAQEPGVWLGALIIAAESEQQAREVYRQYEEFPPVEVIQWQGVTATGEPRLLYDW